jgi:hypothetical protein
MKLLVVYDYPGWKSFRFYEKETTMQQELHERRNYKQARIYFNGRHQETVHNERALARN